MTWSTALLLGALLFAALCFAAALIGERHGSWPRRRNHRRRGTLPPPSDKCQRGGIEAVP